MIKKGEKFHYLVSFVKKGVGKNDEAWVKFNIQDYNVTSKKGAYITVMHFGDLDLIDGDKVTFLDYHVGVHKYGKVTYATIYTYAGDIVISEKNEEEEGYDPTDFVDDLPF